MLALQLGPLALPVAPVLLLASCALALWLASRLAGPGEAHAAGNAVFHAAIFGLVAARLGHVLTHAAAYATSPWAALDVRDGGWNAGIGLLAGTLWLAWRGARRAALRRPLGFGLLAGTLLWMAGSLATRLPSDAAMPELALATFDDASSTSLARAAAGRPAVVNLWASWCGPCRAEMPTLAAAQQREAGVAFLFVNQGEGVATVRAYLEREKLALSNVLLDAHSALGPAVGSRGLPTTLFYDARGRLIDAHMGVLNAAALEARLQSLRAISRP